MRAFLCGKGTGAEVLLAHMHELRWQKIAVFTHPGAGLLDVAADLGIMATTDTVNDPAIWPFTPDLLVSVGYLRIIRPAVVRCRSVNCHYALLPNHRGRSSVPWAIVDGDTVTGITYHWIDAGIDTGRILLQATCRIETDETQASLFPKLHRLAVDYFPAAAHLARSDFAGVEQAGPSQYHRAGPPHGGEIDPAWPRDRVERFIRAMIYPPLPCATLGGVPVPTMADFDRIMTR